MALGGGDATRIGGGSTLAALLCDFATSFFGIEGTGGASATLGTGSPLFGDGVRKDLSVIELTLPRRSRADEGRPCTDPATTLPMEEFEFVLRIVRLVWTSATELGVVGRDRSAAPAAAAASEALDGELFRKA